MTADEWRGEPHVLIVRSVAPPDDQFDDGDLDYDIQHPPTCEQEHSLDGHVADYSCDVSHAAREEGMATTLRYSGTPITEPGTYRIQGWGRKIWTECGDEYDGGVGVMQPEEATS